MRLERISPTSFKTESRWPLLCRRCARSSGYQFQIRWRIWRRPTILQPCCTTGTYWMTVWGKWGLRLIRKRRIWWSMGTGPIWIWCWGICRCSTKRGRRIVVRSSIVSRLRLRTRCRIKSLGTFQQEWKMGIAKGINKMSQIIQITQAIRAVRSVAIPIITICGSRCRCHIRNRRRCRTEQR